VTGLGVCERAVGALDDIVEADALFGLRAKAVLHGGCQRAVFATEHGERGGGMFSLIGGAFAAEDVVAGGEIAGHGAEVPYSLGFVAGLWLTDDADVVVNKGYVVGRNHGGAVGLEVGGYVFEQGPDGFFGAVACYVVECYHC